MSARCIIGPAISEKRGRCHLCMYEAAGNGNRDNKTNVNSQRSLCQSAVNIQANLILLKNVQNASRFLTVIELVIPQELNILCFALIFRLLTLWKTQIKSKFKVLCFFLANQ